jgi:hypothetical protein
LLFGELQSVTGWFTIVPMSEHEEPLQIGRLVEDYNRLKDEVGRLDERVDQAHRAYQTAAIFFRDLTVQDDQLVVVNPYHVGSVPSAQDFPSLLSARELIELFSERTRLRDELGQVRDTLRGWLNQV